ncbi:MAG: NUDIX hydrolase [Methylococcales bacterium]|jgi:ADP-ribose pyrophosphatase YjhB (NUDIX family)|nr:NUDIX hydrolase [Methylococcales bacterium]MBT7444853.1 NUDIX hydrolase [Methylococcales bacterium]
MKFCSECSSPVELAIPDGDNRPRHICNSCNTIHYVNPKIVAGCLAHWEDKVLLCKRAIEPRYGLWTLPAGFMENGESTEQAALRETWEEATAKVSIQHLYTMYSIPHISHVYLLFRGQLDNLAFKPGVESLDVKLFTEDEIPWGQLAFPVVTRTLKQYFQDRRNDHYPLDTDTIIKPGTTSS